MGEATNLISAPESDATYRGAQLPINSCQILIGVWGPCLQEGWMPSNCSVNDFERIMRFPQSLECSRTKSFCLLTLPPTDVQRFDRTSTLQNYGIGNERRLTGKDDTASINDFSWGGGPTRESKPRATWDRMDASPLLMCRRW